MTQFIVSLIRLLVLLGGMMTLNACTDSLPPLRPFPQHLDYGAGSYLPNQHSRTVMDEDIRIFYNYWKDNYLVRAGYNFYGQVLYRVAQAKRGHKNHAVSVSEGLGYGMIIVAIMAGHDPEAQSLFNGLWGYTRAHPSALTPELMAWRIALNDSKPGDQNSAFDGDADIAYALILADQQWGNSGNIHYAAEARALIDVIKRATIGSRSQQPLLGDWVDPSGQHYNEYTSRTSDFMLANFRAFHRMSGDPDWLDIINRLIHVSQSLQQNYSPQTGLLPDFIQPIAGKYQSLEIRPAAKNFLESKYDGRFYYNASRVPLRLGMDALLNKSLQSKQLVQKMSDWLRKQYTHDLRKITAGFKLDGTPLQGSDYSTMTFVAPFGVAAMTTHNSQQWLNKIYNTARTHHGDYYEDSINLLALLLMSGNFWDS